MHFCWYNITVVKKNKRNQPKSISNRRAKFDYSLDDSLLVGIVLTGAETKALRHGRGQLSGAYVTVKDNELWLINSVISATPGVHINEEEQSRSRKLLAKKREIAKLTEAKKQGLTIVPLEILTRGRFIKVKIALGRGKKRYDKRQILKAHDEKKRVDSAIVARG